MKSEKLYDNWKRQRSQVEVGDNFTEKAISRIYQYEQKKRKMFFDMQQLIEFISVHPLAKAALIATGAIAGFVRFLFMVMMILNKGVVNG